MKTSTWDLIPWVFGFLANLGLFYTLLTKSRLARFPVFSSLVALQIVRTLSLFAVRKLGGRLAYFDTYWLLACFDYVLQLGLILEIGRTIFSSSVGIMARAKTRLILWCGLSILFAVTIAWAIPVPPADMNPIWDTRISLLTSLAVCQCYVIMSRSVTRLNIQDRAHVVGIGNGFVLWSAVATARDGIYVATRWHHDLHLLDELQMLTYICVTIYWTAVLWRDEPKREAIWVDLRQSENASDVGRRAS